MVGRQEGRKAGRNGSHCNYLIRPSIVGDTDGNRIE